MLVIAINHGVQVAAPIGLINAVLDITVKRGIRPIRHSFNPAVFQRVHVDIIHVSFEIGVIADEMLPVMPLPDSPFPGVAADISSTFRTSKSLPLRCSRLTVKNHVSPGMKARR